MEPEQKLKQYIKEKSIQAHHLHFDESCHTVEEAARAAKADADDFVKSMCLLNSKLVVAIILGDEKVSLDKVAQILNIEKPTIANPQEVLENAGYPVGGVPPFGFQATFLLDKKIMEKEAVYAGGGSNQALIKIAPQEIKRINKAQVVRIGK